MGIFLLIVGLIAAPAAVVKKCDADKEWCAKVASKIGPPPAQTSTDGNP